MKPYFTLVYVEIHFFPNRIMQRKKELKHVLCSLPSGLATRGVSNGTDMNKTPYCAASFSPSVWNY